MSSNMKHAVNKIIRFNLAGLVLLAALWTVLAVKAHTAAPPHHGTTQAYETIR